MQLFVFSIILLSFSIRCLCDTRLQVEKLSVNSDRSALECLETVIRSSHWLVHDFLIIPEEMDAVDADFFQRFPNIRWNLHSVRSNNLTGFSNVIIFTTNFDSLKATMSAINFQRMDSRAKFVISVTENFESLDEIQKASTGIPAAMWKLDKTHVIYLVPCNEDIFAMTYFPFARNCQAGDLQVLDMWRGEDFVKGVGLFPEKMLDIRGCVQNHVVGFPEVSALQLREDLTETGETILGGVGGRLITIVAEKMNMKLHAVTESLESWIHFPDQVARGKSLFLVSGTIPIAGQTKVLDLDSGYMEESFVLVYNAAGFETSWKNLICPLSKEVWQWIGFTGLLFCGLLIVTDRCSRSTITSEKLGILKGFGIFFGTGQVLPRSYFGRYLFGMWIVYSYLINVAYNSGLVSFLTTPNENRVINTFKDLLADGIEFGGGPTHREFYHDLSDPIMMKMYNNFKIWSDPESLRRLKSGQAATGLITSFIYMYNSNQTGRESSYNEELYTLLLGKSYQIFNSSKSYLFTEKHNHRLRMLKEKIFTYHVPITMRRGSPFTFGVRRYTSRAIQGGFNVYWLKYYTHRSSSAGAGAKTPIAISVQHIKGIVYLHGVGLMFSCVVFFGELIFHKPFRNGSLR